MSEITTFLSDIGIKTKNFEYLRGEPVFETEAGKETVKIGSKNVPLNKKLLNYQYLETFLFGYGLSECLDRLKKDEGNYSTLFYDATTFLGDILKYNDKVLPEYNDLVESLIIRTCNLINDKSQKLFRKYDTDIKEGEFEIQQTLTERQMKTLQDAENNKMISFSVYPSNGIFSKGALVSVASTSLTDVSGEMSAHSFSARMMRDIKRNSAQSTLNENLYELLSDELSRFTLNYEDIYVKAREDLFEKINYRSDAITDCPYKYEAYLENEKFTKEDFPGVKKLLDFYGIKDDFILDLEHNIAIKVSDSIEEDKGEYKGNNLELYYYLTGKKSVVESHEINENIFSNYLCELESFLDEEFITDKDDVKRANEIIKKVKKNESVFTKEQLKELNILVDKVKKAQKKDLKESRKNDKKRKKIIITLIAIAVFVITSFVLYAVLGEEKSAEIIGPALGVIVLVFLYLKFRKARKKAKDFFKYGIK